MAARASAPELSVPELSVVVPIDPTKHGGPSSIPGQVVGLDMAD
jgi:hypothetical protein